MTAALMKRLISAFFLALLVILALIESGPQAAFVPRLKKDFPGLKAKWALLPALRYDAAESGISPAGDAARSASSPTFPKTYGRPYTIRIAGAAVEIRPVGASPSEAKIQDGIILYPGAYPDASVFLAASASEVEEFYYLESSKAPRRFVQELEPKGLIQSFRVGPQGDLEALDSSMTTVLRLSRPQVFDASGRRIEGRFDLAALPGGPSGEKPKTLLSISFDDDSLRYPVLIDPAWRAANTMSGERRYHTATLLPNGKVLAAGGMNASGDALSTAELYDPVTGAWTATSPMSGPRAVLTM